MNLKNFIGLIKQMMIDYPERYKDDKRVAYLDMEEFIENNLSEEEITIIENNMEYLVNSTSKKLVSDGIAPAKTKELYPREVAGMYLMMIKSNKEKVLNIDKNHLFLIVQSFGGINYFRYNDVMKGLFDERIINAINECLFLNYTKLYGVLYDLVEAIGKTDNLDIESFMNNFIDAKVYYNLYTPDEAKNDSSLSIEFKQNIVFLKDTILRAEQVNQNEYYHFKEKMMVLSETDKISIESMQRYIEYDKEIQKDGRNRWRRTSADLTLLNIMQYIQIENIELSELIILVNKMNNLPIGTYQDFFLQIQNYYKKTVN